MEHDLHPWVAYAIIPIFAFANADVAINGEPATDTFASTLTWGIIVGCLWVNSWVFWQHMS